MADPLRQAQDARTVIQGARLREKFLWDLGTSAGMPEQRAEELNSAVDELERRYPDLSDVEVGEAEDYIAGLNASQGRPIRQPSKGSGATLGERRRQQRERMVNRGARNRGGGGQSRSRGGSRRQASRGRGIARARWRETGVPQATASVTELVMQGLGLTLGLTLLYLFLRNAQGAPRGQSAIEEISTAGARAVRLLVAPVDPIAAGAYARARGGVNRPLTSRPRPRGQHVNNPAMHTHPNR
jgi:hypothetical protein